MNYFSESSQEAQLWDDYDDDDLKTDTQFVDVMLHFLKEISADIDSNRNEIIALSKKIKGMEIILEKMKKETMINMRPDMEYFNECVLPTILLGNEIKDSKEQLKKKVRNINTKMQLCLSFKNSKILGSPEKKTLEVPNPKKRKFSDVLQEYC